MSECHVLIVEDDPALGKALEDTLVLAGHRPELTQSGERALEILDKKTKHLVLTDVNMPGMDGFQLLDEIQEKHPHTPVVMMTAYGTIEKAVNALHQGAVDYLVKPFDIEQLEAVLTSVVDGKQTGGLPIYEDPSSVQLFSLAKKVASTDSSVLISGESGTGKEILAKYIHQQSHRTNGPFVAINCAAIPENMLEAMLFGHEKGAFTGAIHTAIGKFEQAQKGTLLLDEITEMPLGLQAKLLRVLQEREVEPLGSKRTVHLDVRVIATSNRDLAQAVAAKEFREDLFYRLNVFPLYCRPLRARQQDILPLARYLLDLHAKKMTKKSVVFSEHACNKLIKYPWPGNVREMDNVIQRSLIVHKGNVIKASDLVLDPPISLSSNHRTRLLHQAHGEASSPLCDEKSLNEDLKEAELQKILDAIKQTSSKALAAQRLGISPRTLRYKVARLRELGYDVDSLLHSHQD